jgi:ubiquinone/menaquinone biosynthesis C-methylase UbiE
VDGRKADGYAPLQDVIRGAGREACMHSDPYLKTAARYDRVVEPSASQLRKIALSVVPPRDGISMLDVGCGTGTQLALYARPGCRMVGIDTSAAMLEVARRKLGGAAELRLEDAARMSFEDGCFDLVTIVLALHEMPPETRVPVLRECRRVAKPTGRILAIDYHTGPFPFPMGWVYRLLVTWMELGAGREHFRHYRDFMARGGLEGMVRAEGVPVRHRLVVAAGAAVICLCSP